MLTTRKNYNLQHGYKKQTLSDEFLGRIFPRYRKLLLLIRHAMHDFHFPHLNLLSSIQRQAYILDVHVRCATSETFYSVKISVARTLVSGHSGLLNRIREPGLIFTMIRIVANIVEINFYYKISFTKYMCKSNFT